MQYNEQSGQHVIFFTNDISDVDTQRLRGRYLPQEALDLLLKGTPLVVVRDETSGAILVNRIRTSESEDQPTPTHKPENMNTKYTIRNRMGTALAALAALASTSALAQNPESTEEVIQLSPFEVSVEEDQGYAPSEALSAGFTRSKIFDSQLAITVLTKEFMDDLALTTQEEAIEFVENSGENLGTVGGNIPNSGLLSFGTDYSSRGFSSSANTADFLPTLIPGDRYNTSRFEFGRGANSVVFGRSGAGGSANRSTTRALFRPSTSFELRVDSEGSVRGEFDLNRVLIKDRVALRFATVRDDRKSFRTPSKNDAQRYYGALTFNLANSDNFKAVMNVSAETGKIDRGAIDQPYQVGDAVSPWLAAAAVAEANGDPVPYVQLPNSVRFQNNQFPHLAATGFTYAQWAALNANQKRTAAQTSNFQVPGVDGNGRNNDSVGFVLTSGLSADGVNANAPLFSSFLGALSRNSQPRLIDPVTGFVTYTPSTTIRLQHRIETGSLSDSVVPYSANVSGAGKGTILDFDTFSATVDAVLFGGINVRFMANRQEIDGTFINDYTNNRTKLHIDVEALLPDGSPNPNLGKFFIEDNGNLRLQRENQDAMLLSVNWEWDIARRMGNRLGDILGTHSFVATGSRVDRELYYDLLFLRNVTPASTTVLAPAHNTPGTTWATAYPDYMNNTQRISTRTYIDPAQGIYGPVKSTYEVYPQIVYKDGVGNVVPSTDPLLQGATPAWAAQNANGATSAWNGTDSLFYVVQSQWWKGRIHTFAGYRQDTTEYLDVAYTNAMVNPNSPSDLDPILRDVNGFWPNPRNINPKTFGSVLPTQKTDSTSYGITLAPTPWLRLFYSDSNAATPQRGTDTVDVYSNLIEAPIAESTEFGLRFQTLDSRLSGSVTFFETTENGTPSTTVPTGDYGANFRTYINNIWDELTYFTGNNVYQTVPYRASVNGWRTREDRSSKGVEFRVNYNPTRNWRMTFNVGRQTHSLSNLAIELKDYIEEFSDFWITGQHENSAIAFAPTRAGPAPESELGPDPDPANLVWGDRSITGGQTVQDMVTDMLSTIDTITSQDGLKDSRRPEWSFNLLTRYSFDTGRLKGSFVGGSVRWRGRSEVGYQVDVNNPNIYDRDNPYLSKETLDTSVFMGYERRLQIFNRNVDWRVQLNINNVLDDQKPVAIGQRDTLDGFGTPYITVLRIPTPRTFILTNSFRF